MIQKCARCSTYHLISYHSNDPSVASLPAHVHVQAVKTYFSSRSTCGEFSTPAVTIPRPYPSYTVLWKCKFICMCVRIVTKQRCERGSYEHTCCQFVKSLSVQERYIMKFIAWTSRYYPDALKTLWCDMHSGPRLRPIQLDPRRGSHMHMMSILDAYMSRNVCATLSTLNV